MENIIQHCKDSFVRILNKVTEKLIVAKRLDLEKVLTYAINEEADYKAFNLRIGNGSISF